MTDPKWIILALLVYIAGRELIFWFNTQKLINKVMSRTFHEYQVAAQVGKPQEKAKPAQDMDPNDDMSYLGAIR